MGLLLAAGCGGSGGGDLPPAAALASVEGTIEAAYPNGHPLLFATDDPDVVQNEDELTQLAQDYRVSLGLDALVVDPSLVRLCRGHCEHMIGHSFFDHKNPEGDLPWDRATRAKIAWKAFGENIAFGQPRAEEAFQDWLASESHRKTLEDPSWTHMGSGYSRDPGTVSGHYWAQNFRR